MYILKDHKKFELLMLNPCLDKGGIRKGVRLESMSNLYAYSTYAFHFNRLFAVLIFYNPDLMTIDGCRNID